MNDAGKHVFLTTLTDYIETELRRGRSETANQYIHYFNEATGLERNAEDFLLYPLFTDRQGFISQSLLEGRS